MKNEATAQLLPDRRNYCRYFGYKLTAYEAPFVDIAAVGYYSGDIL